LVTYTNPSNPLVSQRLAALTGNFVYHHQNLVKYTLDLQGLPPKPEPDDKFNLPADYLDPIESELEILDKKVNKTKPVLLEDGKLYFGNSKKEKGKVVPEGYGILKDSVNGEYVEKGIWKGGILHGPAMVEAKDKYRIYGNYVHGKKFGLGYYSVPNSFTYEGYFVNDVPRGKGRVTHQDGTFCVVDIKDESGEGQATCYSDPRYSEVVYKGDYKNFKIEGKGTLYFKDGSRYEGELKNHTIEGSGKLYDMYGDVAYEGKFVNNRPQGFTNEEIKINLLLGGAAVIALVLR